MASPSANTVALIITPQPIPASELSTLTTELVDLLGNLQAGTSLTSRQLSPTAIELHLTLQSCPSNLRECKTLTDTTPLKKFQAQHNLSALIIQPATLHAAHRTPGLIVFDMDSTLIQQEVIDELARRVGKYDQVSAITEAAMRGEAPYTDFAASLRARVGLLKGVPGDVWDGLKKDVITFTPGARELVKGLRQAGWKSAVLSGGFMPLAEWVQAELGLDFALANFLVEEEGLLTGELLEGKAIVDGAMKATVLNELAAKWSVEKESIVAVGDGSNDLLMMEEAGMGVAFNAKEKVQERAPVRLNAGAGGLREVFWVLGYSDDEIQELTK
ncbi:unnamed protein product [Zymoseptoria tritici ST99CH_3D7]|uniref:phosphoserine phosphatase n=1 Tax=Zymoseptoria tritici (strain ST99CH_3D7) TaxID=1276538 RepID=A0A1X7S9H7_ZYMT9|nr:unnamed protein product [Zymoseptoria tritici ST99CH_3D7]